MKYFKCGILLISLFVFLASCTAPTVSRPIPAEDSEETSTPEEKKLDALLDKSKFLADEGRYDDAVDVAKQAVEMAEHHFGPEHPNVAMGLNNLAEFYHDQALYAEARPLYERALEIREKALGPRHLKVATSLNNLALLYEHQGLYAKAKPLYERALKLREKFLDPQHLKIATSLNNLARIYYEQGRYAKAEPLYERALEIHENVHGPEHPDVADSLSGLGVLYASRGLFTEAKQLFERSLEIDEKAFGPDHPKITTSLNNLAQLHRAQGLYAKAEPLYKRALEIRKEFYGPDHPEVALSLHSLAGLYYDQGLYTRAEPLYKRALEIGEEAVGPEHPYIATGLISLGLLYSTQGLYSEAESLYKRALEIYEKTLGPEHPYTATSLDNLAGLYSDQGLFAEAEPLHKRSLEIKEKSLGPEHPGVATSLNNLGILYREQGLYAKAEPLLERALKIFEEALGPKHPRVGTALNNLANLYGYQGLYAAAEPLHERALEIRENAFGSEHPSVATSLNSLATVYCEQGLYSKAEPLNKRAMEIYEKAFGPKHPSVATLLNNLAVLYIEMEKYDDSFDTVFPVPAIIETVRENVYYGKSERQRIAFEREGSRLGTHRLLLTLSLHHTEFDRPVLNETANWLLRNKAVVADSMLEDRQRISDDSEAQKLWNEIRDIRTQISTFMFEEPGEFTEQQLRQRRERIEELTDEAEVLERKLSRKAGRYREGRRASRVNLEQVKEAIPDGHALIEITRFHPIATAKQREELGTEDIFLPAQYAAFIISREEDEPKFVELGSAEKIDALIDRYRSAMRRQEPVTDFSRRLYELVWTPIEKHLRDTTGVIISPDGELNFLSFATFISPDDRYVIEKYNIAYVGSGRDLVRQIEENTEGAVLFGDPDFGLEDKGQRATAFITRDDAHGSVMTDQDRSMLTRMRFEPLPGTRKEVEAIRELLKQQGHTVETWLGAEASEPRLKTVNKPAILHLATHGFFLPDTEAPEPTGPVADLTQRGIQPMPAARAANPMHRSGFALAGASRAIVEEMREEYLDDGIVTAEEVGTLDLWGTRLVALSACDTGLGELTGGEGVMGLRRAFVQAGAKNLLITLWRVPDTETAELMIDFYGRYLKDGCATTAMTQTQRSMITKARESGEDIHPRKWGAFVVSIQGSLSETDQ